MTSTNVNIGLDSTGRMTSRVLKPPGGGHTDIFSSSEPEKPRPRQHQLSSIVLGTDDLDEKPKRTNGAAVEQPDGNDNAETTSAGDSAKEEAPVEQQPAKAEAPRRTRVPPGGFSSGLW